jgi:hypothetical protein
MKLASLSVVVCAASLVACASAQKVEQAQPVPQPAPQPVVTQAPHPYALPVAQARVVPQAPTWFVKLPEDTTDMMFAAGTATSVDEQMAYSKARMFAEQKLVEQMNASVRSMVKSHRTDTGDSLIERFESTVQKTASGELIGAQRVDSQVTYDGRQYKVYVLLRYPLGENNILRREREAVRARKESELRAARAHQELERTHQQQQEAQDRADQKLRDEIGPKPNTPPQTVSTNEGSVKLLDVDNEEYKRKRDETLQKPGAVVGQVTVR